MPIELSPRRFTHNRKITPPRRESGAPSGWHAAHSEFWKKYASREFEEGTNARWKEATGVAPEESHFTLMIPIHNEEKYLPDALGALIVSDVPSTVNMNVLFVTNASTDASALTIRKFMEGIGEVHEGIFDLGLLDVLEDEGLNPQFATTRVGNTTFTHIDTQTAGKANAMNIGNILALENEHTIAMSVDANNFLEPESIKYMFADAHSTIIDQPDGTAIIAGNDKSIMLPTKTDRIKQMIRRGGRGMGMRSESKLNGWFNAWDTSFVEEIGGIPRVAAEDYALGVAVRRNGRSFHIAQDAGVWGYEANTMRDRIDMYARSVRGKLQILDQNDDPEIERIVLEDADLMKPLRDRVKNLAGDMKANKKNAPFLAVKFLMLERGRQRGIKDFHADPKNHSWESIGSTK